MKRMLRNHIESLVRWMTDMSYVRLGLLYFSMITFFGAVYFVLAETVPGHAPSIAPGPQWIRFLNGIYFSIITAASVGYGDIYPHGISKAIASFESVLSLFTFAILVSKPISQKQEAALYEMHKIAFDQIFTSIREGLFIIRKDFDKLILDLKKNTRNQRDMENVRTALRQGKVIFGDIPRFYESDQKLYRIDPLREELLVESVERTIERLQLTLTEWMKTGEDLPHELREELRSFEDLCTKILQRWRKNSSRTVHASLERCHEIVTRFPR